MTKWERLEEWLVDDHADGGRIGSSVEIGAAMGLETAEARDLVQSHLSAQRGPKSRTLFVLHRTGRTKAAVWHAGVRVADARSVAEMTYHDINAKVRRTLAPDLRRIAHRNPRAAQQCEIFVSSIIDGAMKVLAGAVGLAVNGQEEAEA